ncbi:MAG: hypothetical protein U0798_06155 [Gemmataceae bacterium]
MSIQLIIVLIALALAACYVTRATYLTWFGSSRSCASGCGKCGASESSETVIDKRETVPGRISLLQ